MLEEQEQLSKLYVNEKFMSQIHLLINCNQVAMLLNALNDIDYLITEIELQIIIHDSQIIFILYELVYKNITVEITCKCIRLIFKLINLNNQELNNIILECGISEIALFLLDSQKKQIIQLLINYIIEIVRRQNYLVNDFQIMIVDKPTYILQNQLIEIISSVQFRNFFDLLFQHQIMGYLSNFIKFEFQKSSQAWHHAWLANQSLQRNRDSTNFFLTNYYSLEKEIKSADSEKRYKAFLLMQIFIELDRKHFVTFQQEYLEIIYSILIGNNKYHDINQILNILSENCYMINNISKILNYENMAHQLLKLLRDQYLQSDIVEPLLAMMVNSINFGSYSEVNLLLRLGLLDIYKYYIEFVYNRNFVSYILDSLYQMRLRFFKETEVELYYQFYDKIWVKSLLQYDEEIQQKGAAIINYSNSSFLYQFHSQKKYDDTSSDDSSNYVNSISSVNLEPQFDDSSL